MFCSQCGSPLRENDVFCQSCGSRVSQNVTIPVPNSATPVQQFIPVQPINPVQPNTFQPKKHSSVGLIAFVTTSVIILFVAIIIGAVFLMDALFSTKDKPLGSSGITATLQIQKPAGTTSEVAAAKRDATLQIIRHRLDYLGYTNAKVSATDTTVTIKGIPGTADMDYVFQYLTSNSRFELQDPDGKFIADSADFSSVTVVPPESADYKYLIRVTFSTEGAEIFNEAVAKINARKDGKNYILFVLEGKPVFKVNFKSRNKETDPNYGLIGFRVPNAAVMTDSTKEIADILNSGGILPVALSAGTFTGGSSSTGGNNTGGNNTGSTKILKNKITNPRSFYSFLKIPDNYHCKMVMTLNGEQMINGEYWYKDGKGKMKSALSMGGAEEALKAAGVDMSKFVTFFNEATGDLYTCMPSLKVAVRSDVGSGAFYDQSNMESLVDPAAKFTGTRAVTMDGLQCTVYSFEYNGCKVDYYVRNSLNIIIRCVADTGVSKVDVYLKDMDIGMVTSGDVLMTNEYNNYKKFDNYQEFGQYLVSIMLK